MKPSKLVQRDSIRVFSLSGRLVVIVTGHKAADCKGPRLFASNKHLELRCDCSGRCHPKHIGGEYFLVQPIDGDPSNTVNVRHANGVDYVVVQDLDLDKNAGESESILGISQDFSLEAAFKDALRKINPAGRQPTLVEVVSMGALYGGFSGFSRLFVRVSSIRDCLK